MTTRGGARFEDAPQFRRPEQEAMPLLALGAAKFVVGMMRDRSGFSELCG